MVPFHKRNIREYTLGVCSLGAPNRGFGPQPSNPIVYDRGFRVLPVYDRGLGSQPPNPIVYNRGFKVHPLPSQGEKKKGKREEGEGRRGRGRGRGRPTSFNWAKLSCGQSAVPEACLRPRAPHLGPQLSEPKGAKISKNIPHFRFHTDVHICSKMLAPATILLSRNF